MECRGDGAGDGMGTQGGRRAWQPGRGTGGEGQLLWPEECLWNLMRDVAMWHLDRPGGGRAESGPRLARACQRPSLAGHLAEVGLHSGRW